MYILAGELYTKGQSDTVQRRFDWWQIVTPAFWLRPKVWGRILPMPHQTEPNVNNALGTILQGKLFASEVLSEHTQVIQNKPGLQPDILITAWDRSPVVIEAEYMPAYTVEAEARSRLGLAVTGHSRPIEAVVALRYPEEISNADDLSAELSESLLSYCVLTVEKYTQTPTPEIQSIVRFPESGWLEGSVEDLADLVRLVSVPQLAVDRAADALERGIERAAVMLDEIDKSQPGVTASIARLLGMVNVSQTRRMAGAIIANALVFHDRIAGMHDGVKPVDTVSGPAAPNPKADTLAAWTEILNVNYWPIFAIGKDILAQLPSAAAANILRTLQYTVGEVSSAGINSAHDLTGRIFQKLIADRKYLATFYTLPPSAALLARLAVAKMENMDWSNSDAIGNLRIADFACGTGALLAAVYDQIAARHENAGGDPGGLHQVMMEEALFGCDVMPSAIHITGSTLSGVQPDIQFFRSRLYTLPYGRQQDGSVSIGSLELLQSSATGVLFNTSDPALSTSSIGEETAAYVIADVPDQGFDLVIMNPPFTRATNHEGAHADITNPAFAAFDATPADQTAMGDRINQLGKGTSYHGNAGIASAFAALAHRKLKPGGVFALVLPLSVASGLSWHGFREMIATGYTDLNILSIAANNKEMSFSSDTGMAECLVVARKLKTGEKSDARRHFASLRHRPRGLAHSSLLTHKVVNANNCRRIEDGPYGGTSVAIGNDIVAEILTSPSNSAGESWSGVRISDFSLAQTAYALSQSNLWLPGSPASVGLSVTMLSLVGKLGLVHRDITSPPPRGPFTKIAPSPTATYPALWNHNASQETQIVCQPDSQLQVRIGMEAKASEVWKTASRAHINSDFTFGSQALAVAFTESRSIGGRVWPNVIFDDDRFDYALSAWGNSTLGLLSYWWHSNRQQSSKAGMTIRSAETLPVLDFRTLSEEQLTIAREIFEEFRDKELQPAYLADADPNRALLDRLVVCDLLGFDESVYEGVRRLAAKWCAEPSVHGGKARPNNAQLVI